MSFDAESPFTNFPLQRSINIMLKKIYDDKSIHTNIKKNMMLKLIKDTCKKTAFSFDNIIYEQIGGVSRGSPLAPILANIIMTELEKSVVQKLYDTFLLVKIADIPHTQ